MFKKSQKKLWIRTSVVFLSLMVLATDVFAGEKANAQAFFTTDIIKIYFLMLLFATIINRILEYLKLILAAVDQKIGFFRGISDRILQRIQRKMDRLGISYQQEQLRSNLQKYLISGCMQLLGFALGIIIAWSIHLDILEGLKLMVVKPYGVIITGLVIGAGVEPVHSFFRIAQEKRKIKQLLSKMQG